MGSLVLGLPMVSGRTRKGSQRCCFSRCGGVALGGGVVGELGCVGAAVGSSAGGGVALRASSRP